MSPSRLGASLAALVVAVGVTSACSDSGDGGGATEVEFFQFKGEAVETFDKLIAQFEQEHPEIDIVQNNVPSPDAALRTRLVKNDVPPLMSLNGNGGTYGDLANAGIFRDFTGIPHWKESARPRFRSSKTWGTLRMRSTAFRTRTTQTASFTTWTCSTSSV
jgi:raffinose/stachyose/melibiose transport system substrate-binding protein